MYTTSDVFNLTDLLDLRQNAMRPTLRYKRIAVIVLSALFTVGGVIGVHSVRTSMRHSRVATGVHSLSDAVAVQAKLRGGELVNSGSDSLRALVGHSAVTDSPWEVASGIQIDRLAWDHGTRKMPGNRVAVGITTNDRLEAAKLFQKLSREVSGFRGGKVGGHYRLDCGAPTGKSFVLCFRL